MWQPEKYTKFEQTRGKTERLSEKLIFYLIFRVSAFLIH